MKLHTTSEAIQGLRNIHYGSQLRPMRDWFVLIIIAIMLLGFGAVWNVLEFNHIITGKIVAPPSASHRNVLNGMAIQKVRDIFTARAKRQLKYESKDYPLADPSK